MLFLSLVAGFALLMVGGDVVVRGAVSVARRLGISPLIIGLTLVGFGTSSPELFTSIQAAIAGSPGIAIGNVIGSNIANILLILGLAALIRPVSASPAALRRDGGAMLLAALACTALVLIGSLERTGGAVLLAMLVLYLVLTYRHERASQAATAHREAEAASAQPVPARWWLAILFTLGGFALIFAGAELLVSAAIALARAAGVSETLVGLTLVAIGTSLPELVTSVVAALRRQGDIALGNVLGSNIYNVLGILGATAMVQPLPVPESLAQLDIWVMLAASGLLLVFAATGRRLDRIEGGLFLAGDLAYLAYLAVTAGRAA